LGVQLATVPVHEQIRSVTVNSEAVFLLLMRRVICIAAATGSRLDDMEINRNATGSDADASEWLAIHSPAPDILCLISASRVLQRKGRWKKERERPTPSILLES
jgi:hypothetical protein